MFHAAIIDPKKTKKTINLIRAEKFIKNLDAGASIFFVGNIRKNNNNKNVTGVAYDAFDRLAIKTFKKIYIEGIKKFKLKKIKVFIEHAKWTDADLLNSRWTLFFFIFLDWIGIQN